MPQNEYSDNGFVNSYIRRRRELELDKQRSDAQAQQNTQFLAEQQRLKDEAATRAQQFGQSLADAQAARMQEQEQQAAMAAAQGLFKPGEKTVTSMPFDPTKIPGATAGGVNILPTGNVPPMLTSTAVPPGGFEFGGNGRVMIPTTPEERATKAATAELEVTKAKNEALVKQRLAFLNQMIADDPSLAKDKELVRSLTLQAHGMIEPKDDNMATIGRKLIDEYYNAPDAESAAKSLGKVKMFRSLFQQDYMIPRPSASIENQHAIGKRVQDIYVTARKRLPPNPTSEQVLKAVGDIMVEYPDPLNAAAAAIMRNILGTAPGRPQAKPADLLDKWLEQAMGASAENAID